jgi:presqualene diphosphate synthase
MLKTGKTNSVAVAARAKGSSFYLAMRVLPQVQRAAMFEIYSFCRAVDDIADGDAPRSERLNQLMRWRQNIEALYTGRTPVGLEGLARLVEHFALRKEDFLAIIDGVEMDALEDIRAPEMQKLDLYCDRVASAVGRLSVRVFGLSEGVGVHLAYHLGRALQLTNILRDIDEDAGVGRLYLPHEALQRAGIHTAEPLLVVRDPALGVACMVVVERAWHHFDQASEIMAGAPRRAVRAARIMERAYRQMLEDMLARGWTEPRARVRINRFHLLRIVLQYAFI